MKNYVADQVIGFYQRYAPKNTGQAHEAGERELALLIDEILTEIGL